MVVRLNNEALPSFVSSALLVPYILDAHEPLRMRAAQPHLNAEELGDVALVLPPTDEQHAIVAHLEKETAKLDALREATERTIGLLKERRAALIAAAVTGKLEISQNVEVNTRSTEYDA
jgi:type I restriction enzyme S subunit